MSLKDIRSECSDVAGLLQPYVDAELNEQEQEQVAAHLEDCSGCRAAVSEQAWVRATLQALEREPAPRALRSKVLLGLDEVDRERAAELAASAPPSFGARFWARLRDLGRGGLIMVPASAVAVALFFMAREGVVGPEGPGANASATASPGFGLGSALVPGTTQAAHGDEDVLRAISELEPQVGFRVQVPNGAASTTQDLQLVGARLHRTGGSEPPAADLRYQLPGGQHVVDRQLPAASFVPRGAPASYSGRSYHLHRDDAGRPALWFELGGVAHLVVLEGGPARAAEGITDPEHPDYATLLRFAARLDGAP